MHPQKKMHNSMAFQCIYSCPTITIINFIICKGNPVYFSSYSFLPHLPSTWQQLVFLFL